MLFSLEGNKVFQPTANKCSTFAHANMQIYFEHHTCRQISFQDVCLILKSTNVAYYVESCAWMFSCIFFFNVFTELKCVCERAWESFWSRGLSHFEQARWGQRLDREATLVPCHHPKTELLQNILKCYRVFGYRDMWEENKAVKALAVSKRQEIQTTERVREQETERGDRE